MSSYKRHLILLCRDVIGQNELRNHGTILYRQGRYSKCGQNILSFRATGAFILRKLWQWHLQE